MSCSLMCVSHGPEDLNLPVSFGGKASWFGHMDKQNSLQFAF